MLLCKVEKRKQEQIRQHRGERNRRHMRLERALERKALVDLETLCPAAAGGAYRFDDLRVAYGEGDRLAGADGAEDGSPRNAAREKDARPIHRKPRLRQWLHGGPPSSRRVGCCRTYNR